LSTVTTTNTDTLSLFRGTVKSVEHKNGSTVLAKTLYQYTTGPDGGMQLASEESFDGARKASR
jgi:hypothetical protein